MVYYNENDPKTAAWLRELIRADHIASGIVDERSIVDVRASDLTDYTQCHFFAGIGGWSYALRLAGWPDNQAVWTGSCPCQPLSCAGKRKGHADKRHLWPAFYALIAQCKPAMVFGEQVAGPDGREWFAGVRADLEGTGYAVGGADLCAACVGSPNIRQRIYWVAHASDGTRVRSERCRDARIDPGRSGKAGGLADSNGGIASDGELQRSGGHLQQSENKTTGGVVQSDGTRRMAGESSGKTAGHGNSAESAGSTDGMGNANQPRSQGWNERIVECSHQWPAGTPNLVVLCQDGKARRFEPGSFPLAHGVSGRVGLLRGYGNAIIPQVAAEFIKAATG